MCLLLAKVTRMLREEYRKCGNSQLLRYYARKYPVIPSRENWKKLVKVHVSIGLHAFSASKPLKPKDKKKLYIDVKKTTRNTIHQVRHLLSERMIF